MRYIQRKNNNGEAGWGIISLKVLYKLRSCITVQARNAHAFFFSPYKSDLTFFPLSPQIMFRSALLVPGNF